MRRLIARLSILLFVALLLVGCSSSDSNSNNRTVNSVKDFSIYLIKDLTVTEAMGKNLNDLPLEEKPMLTDKEITKYNWKEHTFTLQESFSLEEKLEGKVSLSGRPFVVVVGSDRVYLGSFWNYFSSAYNPVIPTISSSWFKSNNKDTYTISYITTKKDPRDDIRIYESLKGLGKIIDE